MSLRVTDVVERLTPDSYGSAKAVTSRLDDLSRSAGMCGAGGSLAGDAKVARRMRARRLRLRGDAPVASGQLSRDSADYHADVSHNATTAGVPLCRARDR